MTIAVGAHASATGTTGTVATGAVTTQATGSSFLVFIVGSAGSYTPSFSDSFSNSYALVVKVTDTASASQIWAYLSTNGSGGSNHTVNLTNSVGYTYPGLFFVEITGAATSNAVDVSGSANISSGGVFTNQVTTTVPNDLVLSFVETADTSGNIWTASTGLTKIENQQGGPGNACALGWQLVASAGSAPTNTPTWTQSSGATDGALVTVSLKSPISGTTVAPSVGNTSFSGSQAGVTNAVNTVIQTFVAHYRPIEEEIQVSFKEAA